MSTQTNFIHGDKVASVDPTKFRGATQGRIIDHIDRKDAPYKYQEFFRTWSKNPDMIIVEFYDAYNAEYFLQLVVKDFADHSIKKI